MSQKCKAFDLDDVNAAWDHMDFEILEDYGDYAQGQFRTSLVIAMA